MAVELRAIPGVNICDLVLSPSLLRVSTLAYRTSENCPGPRRYTLNARLIIIHHFVVSKCVSAASLCFRLASSMHDSLW